uniref:alpha-glucosidase C-terminal domain-containing protein n=1 Tax=Flavobacterium sp. TaxID=239 RepID=UPI00404721A2
MGNKHLTETKHPRRRTGKALTPLHEKLKNVEWGEFRIGDLFEKLNLRFLKSEFDKDQDISRYKTDEFNLPLVNAKDGDNGIMYYGRSKDFESEKLTIDIVNDGAISTGNVYSQPQNTGVLYNAYLIKPNFKTSESCLHFFTTSIFKSIKHKFGYENKAAWQLRAKLGKLKNENIALNGGKNKASYTRINTTNENVLVFEREKNGNKIIYMANLSSKPVDVKIPLNGTYIDVLSGEMIGLNEKLNYPMKPWQYYVLTE